MLKVGDRVGAKSDGYVAITGVVDMVREDGRYQVYWHDLHEFLVHELRELKPVNQLKATRGKL